MVQLEIVLAKIEPITWPSLLATSRTESQAGPSSVPPSVEAKEVTTAKSEGGGSGRKNWDRVVNTELGEEKEGEGKDPVSNGVEWSLSRVYIRLKLSLRIHCPHRVL